MRVVIVAACAALLLTGCKKEQPAEKPVEQVEAPKPVVEAPPKQEAPPQEQPPAEEKIKLTAEDVEKYVKYSDLRTPHVLKLNEELKAIEANPGVADALTRMEKAKANLKAGEAQAQKDAGLSEAQVEELTQLVSQVLNGRKIWKMGGGDKTLDDMKKNAANAPPEAKAEIDAQLKTMEDGLKKMRDATDARAQWGDPAVDAVLKNEEKLAANYDKLFGAAFGK